MAIYHFHLKKVSKKEGIKGKSLKHAKYILREDEYENIGREHEEYILREGSFNKKNDLEYKEHGNMPEFTKENPKNFWRAAEKNERKNGVIYREFEIALPVEFSREQNIDLVKEFVEKELGQNYVYTFAIHKPKSLTKKDMEQPHVHLMFCDRRLDGIERNEKDFFKRYNPKNPESGGAGKESEWQTKEKLIDLRKSWEKILNSHLEKNNIEQRVSCETLAKQREKFLDEGNNIEAERLDREVINIDGRILYKKEQDLTDYEKKLKEDFFEKIRLKEIKENIYSLKKENQRVYKDYENNGFEEKSLFELEKDKRDLIKQIEKLEINLAYENLKKTAINQLTSRRLYNLLNENKKIDKEIRILRNKLKDERDFDERETLQEYIKYLNMEKDKVLKEYNLILQSYNSDNQKKNQLIRKMESIKKSYEKKKVHKKETLSAVENLIKEKNKRITNGHKHIELRELLKEYNDKSFREIYVEKEEIKKKIIKLMNEGEAENIEKIILDNLTHNEYSGLLNENIKLSIEIEGLKADYTNTPILKFISKEAKRKKYNEALDKYKKQKEKAEEIKKSYRNTEAFKSGFMMMKKTNDEKLEVERKNLDNLEIIESIKFREEKSSISRGKMKNKGYEDNIGVNFFLKRKQDEKGEDMEEDIER